MQNRKAWVRAAVIAVPLTIGGFVYANSQGDAKAVQQANEGVFICPVTGEELPCPACCVLNENQDK